MPLVSVIVVSFNEAVFLQRALDSILNQSYENIEIIIGDDGSDDGSIDRIKVFCESFPSEGKRSAKYYVMDRSDVDPKNLIPSIRVSNLLKRGFELATGEYINVLSADDYFIDNRKLEKAINFLVENPNYCTYITGFKYVGAYERDEWERVHSKKIYWARGYLHISCFTFRRVDTLLDRFCDDTGLMYSLLPCGKWKFDDSLSFGYFQRDSGITGKSDATTLRIMEIMLFQDCQNQNVKYNSSTRAHFFHPTYYLLQNRERLKDKKYQKYLNNSSQYDHNLLETISQYDQLPVSEKTKLLLYIALMGLDFYTYQLASKIIYTFKYKIFRAGSRQNQS